MSKILTNTTASPIAIGDAGVTLAAGVPYTIPPQDYLLWSASSDILSPVGSADVVVNDGTDDLSPSEGIDLIKGITAATAVSSFIIANLSMPVAATEYSYALPTRCRAFEFKARGLSTLQFSDTAGQTGTLYATIPAGSFYSQSNRKPGTSVTLYVRGNKSSEVLEIIYWI